MSEGEGGRGGREYPARLKLVSVLVILVIVLGGGWASFAPVPRQGDGAPARMGRRLLPEIVAGQSPAATADAAETYLRAAARAGLEPSEAFAEAFPDSAQVIGMLALDRDIEDFRDYASLPGAAGAYYRSEAKIAVGMRPLRRNYEAAFAAAWEAAFQAGGGTRTAESGPSLAESEDKIESPYIADLDEVWIPAKSELAFSHPYALDVFFQHVDKKGEVEKGPQIRSLRPGIVVAEGKNWRGGPGAADYQGGGMSPASGNGVVVYDPISRSYCSYFHLSSVALPPGAIVGRGEVLGLGGNTGMNARKEGHGEHVHIEIFDAARGAALSSPTRSAPSL